MEGTETKEGQLKQTIVRHGAASDGDEFSFNYTCAGEVSGMKLRNILHIL